MTASDTLAGVLATCGRDWAVSKWRNLRPAERTATHAIIEGDCRNGPVGISLLPACPADGRERFLEEAGEAVS